MREVHLYSMSTGVYESSGKYLPTNYGMVDIPYGKVFFAESCGRVVHLALTEDSEKELEYFKSRWRQTKPTHNPDLCQRLANSIFDDSKKTTQARVLILGNDFQLSVWKELSHIPEGTVVSYSDIAERVGKPHSARFVANAVVENPVAYLIPCHRVVRANGTLGSYRWGQESKRNLLEAEGCDLTQLGLAI